MKLTKELKIVKPGEIYPITLEAGSECPDWAVSVAEQIGILEQAVAKPTKNKMLKQKLETK